MVMDPARASMTALGAAYRRAYHYTHDTPKVFADRFAALFVSPEEATAIENGFIHILMQAAGLALPVNLHLLPADLEVESIADVLGRSAYDPAQPAFFAWLGVLSYLTWSAIEGTFTAIRSMAPQGGEIVFDYLTAMAF